MQRAPSSPPGHSFPLLELTPQIPFQKPQTLTALACARASVILFRRTRAAGS